LGWKISAQTVHHPGVATLMFDKVGNGPDLRRLNESERRVLHLLAEGHTAKTVAREIGLTPAAVNERLREARRKTGIGSSRELARLLKSQENRHDQMGMGTGSALAAVRPSPDAEPWRPQTGVVAMISLFVAAAAGAAALMGQNNPPVAQIDPLIGRPLERVRDTADLHAQVRSEVRDEKWANQTEAAMRPRLLRLPLVGKEGNELRINCGSTLCEIGGSLAGTATDPYDPKQPLNQAVADLQAKPLSDDLAKLGLKHVSGLFTGGEGKPDRVVFLLYYSRAQ
jgi:DNA-binding CsgD family transcriptional regulator